MTTVYRLIHIKVDPSQIEQAEKLWKAECSQLMIRQPGCRSERLLKCLDEPGEYISYSEWDDEQSIDRYRGSNDHKQIQQQAMALQGARANVKRYVSVS
ncbi:MAG: antibiotic biosynthesis monooxygenase [Hyphomicrobiaceae bacterium]